MTISAKITLNRPIPRVKLMQWIRQLHVSMQHPISLPHTACLARQLSETDIAWEPSKLGMHLYSVRNTFPDFIDATFVLPEDPYSVYFAAQKRYHDLLKAGASGDTDAAIAYCRAELAGEVGHGAMG